MKKLVMAMMTAGCVSLPAAFASGGFMETETTDSLNCSNVVESLKKVQADRSSYDEQHIKSLKSWSYVLWQWSRNALKEGTQVKVDRELFVAIDKSSVALDEAATTYNNDRLEFEQKQKEILALLPSCLK